MPENLSASRPVPPEEAVERPDGGGAGRLESLLPWIGLLSLVAWTRWPGWTWLLPVPLIAVWGLLRPRTASGVYRLAHLLLLLGAGAGFLGQRSLGRVGNEFDRYWEDRRVRAEALLSERLDALLSKGEQTVRELAEAEAGETDLSFRQLSRIRERSGLAAVALYGPNGEFRLWDGTHRGIVPSELQVGGTSYLYADRPLFSYLYFTAPLPNGGTALAAALIKAGLPHPLGIGGDDFVSSFRQATGEDLRILQPERASGPEFLDLTWEGGPLLSVSIVRPTQAVRTAALRRSSGRTVLLLVLAVWLILALAPDTRASRRSRLFTPLVMALLVPVDVITGGAQWMGGAAIALPLSGVMTLERLVLVTVALALLISAIPWRGFRAGSWLAVGAVAVGFPLIAAKLSASMDPSFVAGSDGQWVAFQSALAISLALLAVAALSTVTNAPPHRPRWAWPAAAVALLILWGTGAWIAMARGPIGPEFLALWAIPTFGVAWGTPGVARQHRAWLVWLAAGVIGASAAQVHGWGERLEARRVVAEGEIAQLGTMEDPVSLDRLERMIAVADSLDREGVDARGMLYGAWVLSGLSDEGSAMWFTLWGRDGVPEFELPLGMGGERPASSSAFLEESWSGEAPFIRRLEEADALLIAQTQLSEGRVLTAVVPPRRAVAFASELAELFGALRPRAGAPLTLVPLLEGEEAPEANALDWTRSRERWEARIVIPYPEGLYDARYELELPQTFVLVVRAGLVLLGNVAVLLILWSFGQVVLRRRSVGLRLVRRPFATFRSRVTLALFGFFLLSNVVFGTLVFQTLTGAAERTATALAARVASDAAAFYPVVNRSMRRLSERVGAELLEYRDGALRGGSVDELIELGLYEGWIPYEMNLQLAARDELLVTNRSTLGNWQHLNAYQRLPDGDVVSTIVPLAAGQTALRGREVAELVAFVVILGAALSFALALMVGRTLTRPIQTLQVASERVGSGNLEVRLPQDRVDEFGSVFTAFNRMVRRLRRARRALERTTRRTKAIVEEAATGVIALDFTGRVTLVNSRAQAVFAGSVEVGQFLQKTEGPRGELVQWVELCVRDRLREATSEFQFGDRRIRVRARQISAEQPGGMVLSMEDVTDELRTERILAWGEMARQVAHEVKNPLTPIKLSVQHIQRAWGDRREEFDPVLDRNVNSILKEIDRLAAIAQSFSRFGAPAEAGEMPLEPVDVSALAEDVLTLYGSGGEGRIRFSARIPEGLPRVSARGAEFKEVLLNLLENARAAIEENGSVVIEAVSVPSEVEVRVRDDGSGISDDLIGRIFEPRFSTRSAGAGLGLAIVRQLVESWGGSVIAESGRGDGTVIRLRLRAWESDAEAEREEEKAGTK
jgi:signal transduction histidine kinase